MFRLVMIYSIRINFHWQIYEKSFYRQTKTRKNRIITKYLKQQSANQVLLVSVQFSHPIPLDADKQGHLEISHNHNWTKI